MDTRVEQAPSPISAKMSLTHILNDPSTEKSIFHHQPPSSTTVNPLMKRFASAAHRHSANVTTPPRLPTMPYSVYAISGRFKWSSTGISGSTGSISDRLSSPASSRPRKDTTCTECRKSFKTKQGLSRHYFTVHLKQRPFKCIDCNATFGQKCSLQRHRRSVHNKEDCSFVCEHKGCPHIFTKYSALQSHIKAKHNGEYPFRCAHANCSKTFMWSSSYKSHEETVHGVVSTSSEGESDN